MSTLTVDQTPASIVKIFPKASDLFKERHIDFCCGGDRPLEEVFTEGNYDSDVVLTELNTAFKEWKKEDHEVVDWDAKSLSELVDHIVEEHHAYLKEELHPVGEFVSKIFRVHGANDPHLIELYGVYNEFKMEMEEHMMTEEDDVFPLIKEYENNPSEELREQISIANGGLEDEHEVAGDLLKRMRILTEDFQPPVTACSSYRITYTRLKEMEANTFQHVYLENNVLFKKI